MTAEILSIGTELLMGQIADTDAQYLGRLFPEIGIVHQRRQTVGDNLGRMVDAVRTALDRSDILVTIGGLGPTEDDLTREAIAEATGRPLREHPETAMRLRRFFEERGLPWVDSQLRQAMIPEGGQPIPNPNGTAPGILLEVGDKVVIAMPGPRNEFVPMADGPVRDYLASRATGGAIVSRIVRVCGVGEAVVEDTVRDLIRSENPSVAPYAHPGEVHLRVTARAADRAEAEALLEPTVTEIRRRLGSAAYALDDVSLEASILQTLRERGQTLSVAESCTGGLLGGRLTSVPGSSDVFYGGVIAYSNAVKTSLLGVPEAILAQFGAVSAETAEAMAEGARRTLGSDWGVSITGVAGPGGGTDRKPVGLVFVGVSGPSGATSGSMNYRGNRDTVRTRAVQLALVELRQRLIAET
ncbi:MAG: competence/damage-inducible protein A [Fimbriimonadaceae bacterium]